MHMYAYIHTYPHTHTFFSSAEMAFHFSPITLEISVTCFFFALFHFVVRSQRDEKRRHTHRRMSNDTRHRHKSDVSQ